MDKQKRKYGCIGHQSDGENGDTHKSGNQILGPLWRVEFRKMKTGNRNYSEKLDRTHRKGHSEGRKDDKMEEESEKDDK